MPRPLLLVAVLALAFAGCTSVPKTAEQAYRHSRVIRQPAGGTLVAGPELPFTITGRHGQSSFQALVTEGRVVYYQTTTLENLTRADGTFVLTRAQVEGFRAKGVAMALPGTSVKVTFSPEYIEGFMRRVDEVAGKPAAR